MASFKMMTAVTLRCASGEAGQASKGDGLTVILRGSREKRSHLEAKQIVSLWMTGKTGHDQ